MSDPRQTPDPSLSTLSEPGQIRVPVCDLNRSPGGKRDRQLLFGDAITVLHRMDKNCLVRSLKDGYCGWVDASHVGDTEMPTHRITARASHVYSEENIKSPETMTLSFGSRLTALEEKPTFIRTEFGYVPRQHVHSAKTHATDPAAVAAIFLGTPYLWGGNSGFGIDCSGLVQAACLSCGINCPGDSDQQEKTLGTDLPEDASLERNDLVFWKGHVALVCDRDTLIHANAGHMATVYEPIEAALERIEQQGDGKPTRFSRPPKAGD